MNNRSLPGQVKLLLHKINKAQFALNVLVSTFPATKKIILIALMVFAGSVVTAQSTEADLVEHEYQGKMELQAIGTSNDQVPFWFRTNQYGSIPSRGMSGSLVAQVKKNYRNDGNRRIIDWGFGAEGRLNIGHNSRFILTEAYLKGKLAMFELKGGRSKEVFGITDTTLSSGAFALSGNALGIPKVEVSIPEYWSLPFANKFFAIKGNYAHGWFGKTPLWESEHADIVSSYLHQKSLYLRLGKPESRLKLAGGFNHQVMWGNEKTIEGPEYELSPFQTYWHVVFGKAYGIPGIPKSKIGNHIGSIDQEISYAWNSIQVNLYHQFFYDVGGLYHGNNLRDGLFGLVFRNLKEKHTGFGWKKILVEYMASKSQGGELDAPITPSGDENYYNNYIYLHGWTYKNENLGNNFLTSRWYGREDLVRSEKQASINNRVVLGHIGIEGFAGSWDYIAKVSYSDNFGTYFTSPFGSTTGGIRVIAPPPYFERVQQFSAYLEAARFFVDKRYKLGFALAIDQGDLLYNSFGAMVKVSRHW
ncbi:MAG: capsule assembly Wzi family protein [Agriterribacter sp.]